MRSQIWWLVGIGSIAMLSMVVVLVWGSGSVSDEQPYTGLQDRSIRALSPEQVEGLLEGQGMGYALAAELNHFPGPVHVLDLAKQLDLTAEGEQGVGDI
ncbi:MAG: hypothetical protein WD535_03015, partial [Thermaerobacterales bacterium]